MDETKSPNGLEVQATPLPSLESVEKTPVSFVRLWDCAFTHYDIPLEHVVSISLNVDINQRVEKRGDGLLTNVSKTYKRVDLKLDEEGFQQLVKDNGSVESVIEWLKYDLACIAYLDANGKAIDRFDNDSDGTPFLNYVFSTNGEGGATITIYAPGEWGI